MFESDIPSEDNISDSTSFRSIAEFKKASGFTKKELKILENYFSKLQHPTVRKFSSHLITAYLTLSPIISPLTTNKQT